MRAMRSWFVITAALGALLLGPLPVQAVDAPRWVAALYVQAQQAVGLRWNPVAGATAYKIMRSTTSGSGHAELASVTTPQYFDKTVEPGVTHYYVLVAVAGAESSAPSEERSVAIPGEKKVVELPPTLKDPVLTQTTEFGKTTSKVLLAWSSPPQKVVAFNLYRTTTPGKDYQMINSTSEFQFVDAGLEIGKTYYYAVTALNEAFSESAHSAEKSILITEPVKRQQRAQAAKVELVFRAAKEVLKITSGPFGALKAPVAVDFSADGDLVVLDSGLKAVLVFTKEGEFLYRFGERGNKPGQLGLPLDMAISPSGDIMVIDAEPRIEIFGAKGEHKKTVFLSEIIGDDGIRHTMGGIACGPDSWFVTDDKVQRVYEISYGSNKLIRSIGEDQDLQAATDMPTGSFRAPKRLYYSERNKALVVSDTYNFRVQILRDNGEIVAWGSYGNSQNQFGGLVAICEDGDGGVFTPDSATGTVQNFDANGKFKYIISVPGLTKQFAIGGTTGCKFDGTRFYLAEKFQGAVVIAELTDEIGPPVKKK